MTGWLADTSAVVRLGISVDAVEWVDRVQRALVRTAVLTRLELGFTARSGVDLRRASGRPPLSMMPMEYLTPAVEDRAVEVQELLADRGQHRAPSVADLLVAAVAERVGLTVLHVDKDFELIAEITGQPVERLRLPD